MQEYKTGNLSAEINAAWRKSRSLTTVEKSRDSVKQKHDYSSIIRPRAGVEVTVHRGKKDLKTDELYWHAPRERIREYLGNQESNNWYEAQTISLSFPIT